MMKKILENGTYTVERALFMSKDIHFLSCVFEDGESSLKESRDIDLDNTEFRWKYPLWYCKNVTCNKVTFLYTARSGVWYTDNIKFIGCNIEAPKTFRRCDGVELVSVELPNAQETLWKCKNVKINHVNAKGDYFGFNSEDIEIDDLYLDGNYCFDGGKNIVIRNSTLLSKDSFWNCENVTVINSTIEGEYLAWNSKNLTLINCKIISHQGLCYIKGLKLINCELVDTDLCFEFCEDIDAEVRNVVDSIKNPYSGIIRVGGVKELILEDDKVDVSKTKIVVGYEN